jgi:sulfatase maturation enzyme AslB (radical SAM superfamily)
LLREIAAIKGIDIIVFGNSCAHECRYCFFDNHKSSKNPFNRFSSIADRFLEWKKTQGLTNFPVIFRWFYSDDAEPAVLKKDIELATREKMHRSLFLGGMRMRPESEMRIRLQKLRDVGVKFAYASFAGYGDVHDYWNSRPGDFEFLINTMTSAANLGMVFFQRIFLMKSTLPTLEKLIDKLDELPIKVKSREIYPLFYSGRARYLEDERVTAADLEVLPERVTKFLKKRKNWRTEREWMDTVYEREETSANVILKLYLDDTNIDRIESMSCEEIVSELENRTRAAYAALPAKRQLCEEYGDPTNLRLYQDFHDVQILWLDRYLKKYPIQFERSLTRLTAND